jgi:hypothetical protein
MKIVKENTALMELIRILRNDIERMSEDGSLTEDFHDATECAIFEAQQLLVDEREMIYDAYVGGMNNIDDEGGFKHEAGFVQYYKEKYPTDWQEDDE